MGGILALSVMCIGGLTAQANDMGVGGSEPTTQTGEYVFLSDQSSVVVQSTYQDGSVTLVGRTTPPPGSADFFVFSMDAVAQRKYSGGTGEPNDPYQIALGEAPNDYDRYFILCADIDLDPNLPGNRIFDRAVVAPDVNGAETGFQGSSFCGGL